MTLRIKYILFISIIHLVLIALVFQLFKDHLILFFTSEFLLALSIYFSYRLYRGLIQPIDFIAASTTAIKEEDFSVKFRPTGSAELNRLISVYNEMIDKIREERTRLQENHYFLDRIIDVSPTAIIILDFDQRISMINPAAKSLLHQAPDIGSQVSIDKSNHPVLCELAKMQSGDSRTISWQGLRKIKCQCTTFIDRGFERKIFLLEEMTNDLMKAEKKAYGKVIRMMAHEVNNSIGPINSILQSILNFSTPYSDEDTRDIKEYIEVALDRNQKLNLFTRNFADVIRLPDVKLSPGNLHEPLENAIRLMTPEAKKKAIKFEVSLEPGSLIIPLDTEQFEQVLINILKNSLDAIDREGIVRISTYKNPTKIMIADNGPGIPEEIQANLFTPFFSTKTQGQGIGLTIAREVLYKHNAVFTLETKKSGWTVFEIVFHK